MLHLPEIDAFVERQGTLWDKQRELSPEAPGPNLADQSPPVGGPWITVSKELGFDPESGTSRQPAARDGAS